MDTFWDVADAVFLLNVDLYSGHALYNNLLVFVPPWNMQFHITKIIYILNSFVNIEAVKYIWKDSQAIPVFEIVS